MQASKTKPTVAVDAQRDYKVRPQITENKYYFTNLTPAYQSTAYNTVLIWLEPSKGVQYKWPNTLFLPYQLYEKHFRFFPLQISQVNNLFYIYELKK